ncbi:TniQ family protein [Kitasatospora purpeofusca]|uniref:TniQ family protein n=1 Tax=Kitasatospora purpeofusca TaxID=67352 RepID=UPI00386B3C12|nr:TniQ family protein [Kitasatospora purpeofusca]
MTKGLRAGGLRFRAGQAGGHVTDAPGLRFGPRWPLPGRARLVGGESTGSFVARLAHGNGLGLAEFLGRVGQGQASADPERVERYPQSTEMYVNEPGLRHLAVLSGLPAQMLRRALPSLAEQYVLPGGREALWQWPWEAENGYPVRRCALCGYARQIGEPVWLMSPQPWQVCLRHLRWTDDSRQEEPSFVDMRALPECVRAHQVRLRLVRRFKAAGSRAFADASRVVRLWWAAAPEEPLWAERAWRAGLGARTARAVPLVIYPEAAALACSMLRFERGGRFGGPDRSRWLREAEGLMAGAGLDCEVGRDELLRWLEGRR